MSGSIDPKDEIKSSEWPNQTPVVDGVTPMAEVPQDPYFFADTEDALDREMED